MQRNNHQYKVGDKILVKRKKNSKHELEFMGPFPITKINDNSSTKQQTEFSQHQFFLFKQIKIVFTTQLFLFTKCGSSPW